MSSVEGGRDKNEWFEWIRALFLAILFAFLLRTFIFATSIVEGESMDPALVDGERIIFNKFIYLVSEPARGDIIIIQHPHKNYVKRVIALPNEIIEMNDHTLYIDGVEQKNSFVSKQAELMTGDFGPIEIPNDSYFVMGDNRAISKDSRNGLGFIKRKDIIGKSELIIYPFSDWAITR